MVFGGVIHLMGREMVVTITNGRSRLVPVGTDLQDQPVWRHASLDGRRRKRVTVTGPDSRDFRFFIEF